MPSEILLRLLAFFSPMSVSITQILYGVIVVLFIYEGIKGRQPNILKNRYMKYMIIIAVVLLITTLLADDPSRAFKKYKQVLLPFTFFVGYYLCTERRLNGILFWIMAGGAAATIFGIIRYFMEYGPLDRTAGTFSSPIRYGNMMGLIVVLGFCVLLSGFHRDNQEKYLYALLLAISIGGLYASATRGALIAAVGALIIMLILRYRLKGVVLSGLLVVAATLMVALLPEMRDKFITAITQWQDPKTSFGWRFVLWRESWEVFKAHPITGVGFANLAEYFKLFPVRYMSIAHAHNNYLQILAEHGLIGFLAIAALIFRLFIDQVRGVMVKNKGAFISMALLFTLMIEGLTEYCFFDSEICMMFWLLHGGLMRYRDDEMGIRPDGKPALEK